MSLGEFDFDAYGTNDMNYESYIVWLFFILGTFITMIVFMNLLIAIMGNTYNEVAIIEEESSLKVPPKTLI